MCHTFEMHTRARAGGQQHLEAGEASQHTGCPLALLREWEKAGGNLFPVITHLVSLGTDILHPLDQLFAAHSHRWLLLFDTNSLSLSLSVQLSLHLCI